MADLPNGDGWTGKGVGVAVLDTGINDYRLDWYDAMARAASINAPVFSSGQAVREDGHGHGTHVAGIIGGNSWYRKDGALRGKYIGIAPEATLIDVKVSDDKASPTSRTWSRPSIGLSPTAKPTTSVS